MNKTRPLLAAVFFLLFGSLGEAQEPFLSSSSGCNDAAKAESDLDLGALPFMHASSAYCQADCGNGNYISCWGSTCSAQDRYCAGGAQGHVTCDGQTTYCSPECSPVVCSPGEERAEPDGCCTPYKGRFRWYVCNSSGQWEWTPNYMCYGACTPPPIE